MKKYYAVASLILVTIFIFIFYKLNISYNSLESLTQVKSGYSVAISTYKGEQEPLIDEIYNNYDESFSKNYAIYKFGYDNTTGNSIIYTPSLGIASEDLNFLEEGDFSCYSTIDTSCGHIYDIFSDFNYEIRDLKQAITDGQVDGVYYVVPRKTGNSPHLNHTHENDKFTEKELKEIQTFVDNYSNYGTVDTSQNDHDLLRANYSSLFFTLIVFVIIISLNFFRKNKHKIIIEVFNGYTLFETFGSVVIKNIIPIICIYVTSFLVAIYFIFGGISSYNIFIMKNLFLYLVILLLFIVVFNIIMLVVTYYSNLEKMLKGKLNSLHINILNLIVKYVVLLFFIAQALILVVYIPQYFNIKVDTKVVQNEYESYLNIGSIAPFSGAQLNGNYEKNFDNTFLQLQEEGLILSNIYSDMRFDNVEYSGHVNPNYLEQFPIYDVNGDQIHVSQTTDEVTYLIPSDLYTEDVEKQYQYVNFIPYQSGQTFYNIAALNQMGNSKFYITDPLIEVQNGYNARVVDLFATIINQPIEELNKIFAANNLEGNFSNIYTIGHLIDIQLNKVYLEMTYQLMITLILLFMLIGVSFQENMDFFEKNKDKFVIKIMLGFKYGDIMAKNAAMRFALYCLVGVVYFNFRTTTSNYAIVVLLITYIFDIGFLYIILHNNYSKNLVDTIKGDS